MTKCETRAARIEDANAIAALFALAYGGTGVHECEDSQFVKVSLEGEDIWVVATIKDGEAERLIGCVAGIWHAWNRSYEPGWSVVLPEYRKQGIVTDLLGRCVREMRARPSCEVIMGYSRGAILNAFSNCTSDPAIVPGHDGGMHVNPQGQREALFVSYKNVGRERRPRRIPPRVLLPAAPYIAREILARLSYEDVSGAHPAILIVGPPGASYVEKAGWRLEYNLVASGKSLHITALSGPKLEPETACWEGEAVFKDAPQVEHTFCYVLAEKVEFIRGLKRLGFELTAYLPLWHRTDNGRCDCVWMTRCTSEAVPTVPKYEEKARKIVEALNKGL